MAELAECQRYYQKFSYDLSNNAINHVTGYATRMPVVYPQSMRITPTVILEKNWSSALAQDPVAAYVNNTAMSIELLALSEGSYVEWHGFVILNADL